LLLEANQILFQQIKRHGKQYNIFIRNGTLPVMAGHGLDGKGIAELFPSIADSSMVKSSDPTTSIRIVLRGARSVGTSAQPTASGMPSYGKQLDDDEVAAVLTDMRNTWGGAAPAVTAGQVSDVRHDTALRPD
jgi:mono/diheme cytochrome c family protein